MWLERFNIVELSLHAHPSAVRLGQLRADVSGTGSIFAGTIGLFLTGILLAIRLVPIVSMYEMRELLAEAGQR